jgi:septal ring factor EnvC (AmiA/AmiB activator)
MKGITSIAVLLLACASANEVTPVQKVIQLMEGMLEKGKKEKHDEQVQFAAYKQFCDDTSTEKTRLIAEANQRMEKLTADIQKQNDMAAQLGRDIAKNDGDIAAWQGDVKASTTVREIENGDYMATHKDYSESIAALKEGVTTFKNAASSPAQGAASFAQISSAVLIPEETKKAINDFLNRGAEDLAMVQAEVEAAQPQANAYNSATAGIIEMLEKLVEKFQDEKTELEKQETEARQAFELLIQDLKTYIDTATKSRMDKSEAKAAALESAAAAKGDLDDTTTTRDDDTKYLADVTATCQQKSAAFEERQALRAGEIEAVEKAIEILSSGAVAGASEKHLPQLVQTSYAQLRSVEKSPQQLEVAAFLSDQGRRLNSRILKALALRVSDDPFKKVTKMIKDLIVKLMEEANGEAEQKGWCDDELASNEQTRKEKTEAVEMLHAEIDELEASVSKLNEDIAELSQAVADLDAAVAKATEIREAEKAKNAVIVTDAKAAQVAVAAALKTLKDFYEKAGGATSLVQTHQPEIFDEPYKGMQSESGGVVGMIEVIASDFARLESETTAAEGEATNQYKQFMSDSNMDKNQKNKDIDDKTAKKQNDEQTLEEKKSDLSGTQKELDAGLQYYEKLKPQCIDSGISYEDRVARRKEEIASLQQALQILEGEDTGF